MDVSSKDFPKLRHPKYDRDWILRGLKKHKVNYSMVICFETGDPTRFEQLKRFFNHPPKGHVGYKTYIFEPWTGLGLLKKNGQTEPYKPESGRFTEEIDGKIQNLAQALNIMDQKLKKENTALILYGLSPEMEGKVHLVSALKSWAISRDLIQNRSLVILMGASSLSILDEETKNLVGHVEVKSAKDTEYDVLINYLSNLFGIDLNDDEKGTIRSSLKGLNLHQSEAVLREAYASNGYFDLDAIKTSKGELVKRMGILEIEEPKEGFDAIGGYEEVKNFINDKIIKVIHRPERALEFAIPLPRGILLFGPPGTGKTLFAKALSKTIKLPFINLKTENIYSKWLGESGQRMKGAIQSAEQMSPAIVFVDEIDRFGKRTAALDSGSEETRRVFSQLLEWLGDENRKAIIIGTTNRPEDLDEAFIRTGRFDYKIPINYPDEEARFHILRIHLGIPDENGRESPKPRPPLAVSIGEFLKFIREEIVPKTRNFTGAELEELVTRAKRNSFEREAESVTKEDFVWALASFRIDLENRIHQQEKYKHLAEKYSDERAFLEDFK